MQVLNNDDAPKKFKQAAAIDARAQHLAFWPTYNRQRQLQAQSIAMAAQSSYGMTGSRVYTNARENFIAVKIDKPSPSTTRIYYKELAELNGLVEQCGAELVRTKNSLLIRIPR